MVTKSIPPFTARQWRNFWNKVAMREGGCWEWLGSKNYNGYGFFGVTGAVRLAHRVLWEWTVGPIPEGKFLDHKCFNRACVNPIHLEVVDNQENICRSIEHEYGYDPRTHFKCGHERTRENSYYQRGRTTPRCKVCTNAASITWARNNKDKSRASNRRWTERHPDYMKDYYRRKKAERLAQSNP